ncbi:hypothetical protein C0J52_24372 [Blattella germanica]|nr:hypothetical protein C0J52_24372 [Blattella germanica]
MEFAATKRVENEETLKASALIGEFANTVQHQVDNFLADGVVATCVVVGGIFLSCDELFGVEQLSVCAGSYFICKNINARVNIQRSKLFRRRNRNLARRRGIQEQQKGLGIRKKVHKLVTHNQSSSTFTTKRKTQLLPKENSRE